MNRNVTSIILIVLAIGIYFTYTQGQIDSDKTVMAVNDQYSTAITNAQALKAIRDNVQKDYNKISADDRQRLDRMIPSSVDNIHLIVDISKLALSKGFSLRNLKAEVVQGNSSSAVSASAMQRAGVAGANNLLPTITLSNIKLTFDTSAPYQSFVNFMQDLETSLRIMDVTHLAVKANDSGTYDFSVEINTYWMKQ